MLERLEGPAHVLVVRAVGEVAKDDYASVLEPAVDAMIADHGKVRAVFVVGDDYDGYQGGAAWEDVKFGVEHWTKFERLALVTDHDWMRRATGLLGWLVPGQVKTFDLAEQQQAIDWAAGSD